MLKIHYLETGFKIVGVSLFLIAFFPPPPRGKKGLLKMKALERRGQTPNAFFLFTPSSSRSTNSTGKMSDPAI